MLVAACASCMALEPVTAQNCATPTVSAVQTGGGYYVVRDNGDSLSANTSYAAALARAVEAALTHPADSIRIAQSLNVRVTACVPKPAPIIDSILIHVPPDTIRVTVHDTFVVHGAPDTLVIFDTVGSAPTPVNPPAPPPAPVPPPVVPPSPPMAGTPVYLLDSARLATLRGMVAANHPAIGLLRTVCSHTGTASPNYGDDGTSCALLGVLGDTAATRKAIARAEAWPLLPPNANDLRQNCGMHEIVTSWLAPMMTQSGRDSLATINASWVRWAIQGTGASYVGGFRLGDGDQSTTSYLCAALHDHQYGTHWLDSSMNAKGVASTAFPLGGLGAATLAGSERANLARYAGMCAPGGEWDESSEYDDNTTLLAMLDYAALRGAIGADSLPLLGACLRQYAIRAAWDVTPNDSSGVQWGDDENPRGFVSRLYVRLNNAQALCGIMGDPVGCGLAQRLTARYGWTATTVEPSIAGAWALAVYDPSAPTDTTHRRGTWIASGRGMLWTQNATSLFVAEAQNLTGEDHQVHYTFNAQLYRNGEWALQSPIGYGAPFNLAGAENGVVYAGFSAMGQRGFERADTTGGISCLTGSTRGGLYDGQSYYQPPAAFLALGRRTVCYAQISGTDVVVTLDTVAITPPTMLTRYAAADRAQLDTLGGWYATWHPQVAPTRNVNTWSWTTPKGQPVTLTAFGVARDSVTDEHVLWAADSANITSNPTIGTQLRLIPSGTTLVTVVQVGVPLPITSTATTLTIGGVPFPAHALTP